MTTDHSSELTQQLDAALAELAKANDRLGMAATDMHMAQSACAKLGAELAKVRSELEQIIFDRDESQKYFPQLFARVEQLTTLAGDMLSTFAEGCEETLVTAERQEAWKSILANDTKHEIECALLKDNATLRADLSDASDSMKSLQRENEALRKTVAQSEEHLRDIATISAPYKL